MNPTPSPRGRIRGLVVFGYFVALVAAHLVLAVGGVLITGDATDTGFPSFPEGPVL